MSRVTIVQFDGVNSDKIKSVRNAVFSKEQEIDEQADFDGQDRLAIHALIEEDGRSIGTGRMLEDGHIGRLSVLKDCRGKGYGGAMLNALMSEAKERGLSKVYLGSQIYAVEFYEKHGFVQVGEPYEEVGIQHIIMEKNLE